MGLFLKGNSQWPIGVLVKYSFKTLNPLTRISRFVLNKCLKNVRGKVDGILYLKLIPMYLKSKFKMF